MSDGDRAFIYATGGDSDLRAMCWALIEAGLIQQADLVDRGRIVIEKGDKQRVRWNGMVVLFSCARDALDDVLASMKRSYSGDDLQAVALPVLATV